MTLVQTALLAPRGVEAVDPATWARAVGVAMDVSVPEVGSSVELAERAVELVQAVLLNTAMPEWAERARPLTDGWPAAALPKGREVTVTLGPAFTIGVVTDYLSSDEQGHRYRVRLRPGSYLHSYVSDDGHAKVG